MSTPLRLLALAAFVNVLAAHATTQTAPPSPGAGTTGPAPAAEPAPQDAARDAADRRARDGDDSLVLRSREVLEGDVVDSSGRHLGRIADLVTDGSGEVIAIVERSSGGSVAFPLSRLQPTDGSEPDRTVEGGADDGTGDGTSPAAKLRRFALQGDKEALAGAPSLPDGGLIDAMWMTEYRTHFGLDSVRTARGAAREPDTAGAPREPGAEANARDGARDDQPWRLTSLAGSTLLDGRGDGLGTVEDFAIGFPDGRVSYALVENAARGDEEELVQGVSLDELSRTADGRGFTTRLEASELRDGRGIEGRRLPERPTVGRGSRDGERGRGRVDRGSRTDRGSRDDRGDRGDRTDRGDQGTPQQRPSSAGPRSQRTVLSLRPRPAAAVPGFGRFARQWGQQRIRLERQIGLGWWHRLGRQFGGGPR